MTAGHPMRVAGIDCGTNSIRLLVADVAREPDGRPRLADVHREMRVVRLGEGVDATGRLSSHALDRTWRALADYAAIICTCGAVRTRMVATSATRDAQNRGDFVEMVRSTLGQDPEVITGDQEAELTFAGAVGDLDPATGPFLVVDIGGGSTELVIGERDGWANRLAGADQPGHRVRADHRTHPARRPADAGRAGRGPMVGPADSRRRAGPAAGGAGPPAGPGVRAPRPRWPRPR